MKQFNEKNWAVTKQNISLFAFKEALLAGTMSNVGKTVYGVSLREAWFTQLDEANSSLCIYSLVSYLRLMIVEKF